MFVTAILLLWDANKRSKARARARKADKKNIIKVRFPNPATVDEQVIADYLRDEFRLPVLRRYVEITNQYSGILNVASRCLL